MLQQDAFLEYAEVYNNYYGTPRKQVLDLVHEGKTVLLEIDIQGAMQVKKKYPEGIFIYIVPPSLQELSHRLYAQYDYIVVNDKLDEAVDKVRAIMVAERCKLSRNKEQIDTIFEKYITREVM